MALLPVEDALARMLEGLQPTGAERVGLDAALGRVLAGAVAARRDQPPFAASAMDGYAVRAAERRDGAGELAGDRRMRRPARPTPAASRPGETVRIFTGAPVPRGADAIVIQENTEAGDAAGAGAARAWPKGRYIRPPRPRFRARARCCSMPAGCSMPRAIGLAAAMNVPWLPVQPPARGRDPGDRRRAGDAGRSAGPRPDRRLERASPRRVRPRAGRRTDAISASLPTMPTRSLRALDARRGRGRHSRHHRRRLGRRARPGAEGARRAASSSISGRSPCGRASR